MRKVVLIIFSVIGALSCYALHVECVGNATLLTNNGDTLLLFENKPELKSKIGAVDWYRLPDTISPIQSGTDYLYPEHGNGYMLKVGNERDVFWVFDYDSLRATVAQVEVVPTCENTELIITSEIPEMTYSNEHGMQKTYARKCNVSYMNTQWDKESESWVDSVVVENVRLANNIMVGPTPVHTDFVIVDDLCDSLSIAEDSIVSTVIEPVAIKMQPLAVVTTRPNELSNEVARPVDSETLIQRSAPLIVNFRANAVNANYYQWTIYLGSEKILQRNEAQHQYNFTQPGTYRAVVVATNGNCNTDSVEFDISVSESMLHVPNVFTPNGDGTNDEFRVSYRSIKEFHCWVYNRWGHLVYQWTDPAKGWDGNINGKPAAEGAYYYVIRALGTDAESGYMSKPKYSKRQKKSELPVGVYQLSGDINLIRGGK